jgi:hypothetical protein
MTSEACGAAKPVYVSGAAECQRRFRAFHERLISIGRTRMWPQCGGIPTLEPPDAWSLASHGTPLYVESDVERAASRVLHMLAAAHSNLG